MNHVIANGDVLSVLRELPDNEFDALMCDPPYGFSFMGKAWDYDVPSVDVWREALRVLKPGAPLVAFGGSRTYHRMAVGIEDAGFELRDVMMWLYGSGFPKSLDVSKAIDAAAGVARPVVGPPTPGGKGRGNALGDITRAPKTGAATAAAAWSGYGTALKPAFEPIVLARKPLEGTVAANVAKWGVGGLAIDACRVGYASEEDMAAAAAAAQRLCLDQNANRSAYGRFENGAASLEPYLAKQALGRWPANLILDEDAAAVLDAEVGTLRAGERPARRGGKMGYGGEFLASLRDKPQECGERVVLDSGGPSRFFYTSKVSTREREAGCEHLPLKHQGAPSKKSRNTHPTLKPLSLTQWLARLILPPTPGAQLLVPYSGAGSEMIGALLAGWPAVFGIEGEAEYVQIAEARIAHWIHRRAA